MSGNFQYPQHERSNPRFDDELLWKQFKSGDHKAFREIYSNHVDELFNYGYKVVPRRNLVKDCIQDLFIDLWRNKNRLSDTDHIKFYLIKALRRKIIKDNTKSKRFLIGVDENANSLSALPIENEIIEQQTKSMQKARLSRALSRLPDRQREVINLLFYEEFSYDMVSNIMGISLKSVYNLACKAISSLRKDLTIFLGLYVAFSVLLP